MGDTEKMRVVAEIYETDISIVASIVKALQQHFGSYVIYNADDANILIVARRATAIPAPDPAIFTEPGLRAELARVGIESIEDIRRRRIGDERTLGPLFAAHPAPMNSDTAMPSESAARNFGAPSS